jgi:hypothetical protein
MRSARGGMFPVLETPPPEPPSEGGGVLMGAVGLQHRARPLPRPDFCVHRPRSERLGRGADRGYSFVSMSHHTARGKARPVMG